jgi:hypothetical protein
VPDWVTAAFQEFDTDSAASANANPAVQPARAVVPVFVTVNCSWYPPDQDVVTTGDSAHVPAAAVDVGEADGDGDGDGEGDGEGDGDLDGDDEDRADVGDCRGSGDVLSPVVGPSVADVRAPDAGVDFPLGEERAPGGLDAALDVPKSPPPSATVEA